MEGGPIPQFPTKGISQVRSAPLLEIEGAGPRIDMPGSRKPSYGFTVKTVEPQVEEEKGTLGRLVDAVESQLDEGKGMRPGLGRLVDLTA